MSKKQDIPQPHGYEIKCSKCGGEGNYVFDGKTGREIIAHYLNCPDFKDFNFAAWDKRQEQS